MVLVSASDDDRKQSAAGSVITELRGNRLPFAWLITLEVLACCLSITVALIAISYTASTSSNEYCLSSGETAIQSLATTIQTHVTATVILQIAGIAAGPVRILSSLVELIKLNMVNPKNADILTPYLLRQVVANDAISNVYYGDELTADFNGAGKLNADPPFQFCIYAEDNLQGQNKSSCPLTCPQNQTAGDLFIYPVSAAGVWTSKAPVAISKGFPTKKRPWYTAVTVPSVLPNPIWTDPYVYEDAAKSVGITVAQALTDSNANLLGVAAVDVTFAQMSTDVRALELTKNGFVVVFNSAGMLFASSIRNESASTVVMVNNVASNVIKPVLNLTDANSLAAVKVVYESCMGDLTKLPANNTYLTNNGLILQHTVWRDGYGLSLIVLHGAPLTDYTGDVEAARAGLRGDLNKEATTMVAAAAALLVALVGLSIPATLFLISRPLVRLAGHMEEVSRFDFSSLHGMDRKARSFISELAIMENVFWGMITNFATGIAESNKLGMSRTTGHSASVVIKSKMGSESKVGNESTKMGKVKATAYSSDYSE